MLLRNMSVIIIEQIDFVSINHFYKYVRRFQDWWYLYTIFCTMSCRVHLKFCILCFHLILWTYMTMIITRVGLLQSINDIHTFKHRSNVWDWQFCRWTYNINYASITNTLWPRIQDWVYSYLVIFSFNYVYVLTEKTNHVTHPSDINIAHTNVQYITISKILTEILAHSTPFL